MFLKLKSKNSKFKIVLLNEVVIVYVNNLTNINNIGKEKISDLTIDVLFQS